MKTAQTCLTLIFAMGLLATVGCTADRFTYDSFAHRPTTLTVVSALDESEEIWKMDIPTGTKLVVEFNSVEKGYDDAVFGYTLANPVRMNYWLYPISADRFLGIGGYYMGKTVDEGEVQMPGSKPVKMVVSYRMDRSIYEEVDDPVNSNPLSQSETEPAAAMPSGEGVVMRASQQ